MEKEYNIQLAEGKLATFLILKHCRQSIANSLIEHRTREAAQMPKGRGGHALTHEPQFI